MGGAVNLETVAQQLSDRLGTILKGRSTPYAPDTILPPAGYVFGPESEPHQSYQNGLTKLTIAVTVAVARIPLDEAWKALAGYVSDTGETSVKACLESGIYTAFDTIVVVRSRVGDVNMGGTMYKGAGFDLSITGSGA